MGSRLMGLCLSTSPHLLIKIAGNKVVFGSYRLFIYGFLPASTNGFGSSAICQRALSLYISLAHPDLYCRGLASPDRRGCSCGPAHSHPGADILAKKISLGRRLASSLRGSCPGYRLDFRGHVAAPVELDVRPRCIVIRRGSHIGCTMAGFTRMAGGQPCNCRCSLQFSDRYRSGDGFWRMATSARSLAQSNPQSWPAASLHGCRG